jgi:hypothetical protein
MCVFDRDGDSSLIGRRAIITEALQSVKHRMVSRRALDVRVEGKCKCVDKDRMLAYTEFIIVNAPAATAGTRFEIVMKAR